MSDTITKPYVILCEGPADRSFLKTFIDVRGIANEFELFLDDHKYLKGNTAFEASLNSIPVERGFENVKAILIITDCDRDPAASFKVVQKQVAAAGYTVPSKPLEIVSTIGKPALVVITIPFSNECGNLESYLLTAMSDVWGATKASADRHINDTEAAKWHDCTKAKSIMQCMIAVLHEKDPNKSLSYIWSKNEDFRSLLKHKVFDDLYSYFAGFTATLENASNLS